MIDIEFAIISKYPHENMFKLKPKPINDIFFVTGFYCTHAVFWSSKNHYESQRIHNNTGWNWNIGWYSYVFMACGISIS